MRPCLPITTLCLPFLAALLSAAPPQGSVAGHWEGSILIPAQPLGVIVNLAQRGDGAWSGTIAIPAQQLRDFKLADVAVTGAAISFAMPGIPGAPRFEGQIAPDGRVLAGQFRQGGASFPFRLERGAGSAPGSQAKESPRPPNRPQTPKPPYAYNEEEVTYANPGKDGVLAGTLTYPKSGGPFPAVLLITGSGSQDRDETIFGHKPFLVLADHLTRQGIAMLRVDDRGIGRSTGASASHTSADFASDVQAALAFLKSRKEIDGRRIGLLGHSEGGLIAPMVASQRKDVAFVVLMAGPGLTGDKIIAGQAERMARLSGADEAQAATVRRQQEQLLSIVKQEADDKAALDKLREAILATLPEDQRKAHGPEIEQSITQQTRAMVSPWYRYFLTYDPQPALRKLTCPVLAVNGEQDSQILAQENLAAIRAALTTGGNKDSTAVALPGLNHLFQTCKTGQVTEYAQIEETMAPKALELISEWINRHTDPKR
jgi:uncharacterized protein